MLIKKTLLILSIFLTTACATTEKPLVENSKENLSTLLSNNKFILDKINDEKIMYNKGMNINFKNNKNTDLQFASGNTGCNRFFSDYVLHDDYIKFEKIQSTKRICLNKNDSKNEKLILSMLNNKLKITVDNNKFLFSDSNNNKLYFKKYRK
jgi:heat shock protein HslJ